MFGLTQLPGATLPLVVLGAVVLLYFARRPAHQLITSTFRSLAGAFRLGARSVILAEYKLRRRNTEILLAEGAKAVERELEREFHRVGATVRRDLQSYPAFHRKMADLITRIDEDYARSTETPPSPPAWLSAVDAVARTPETADGGVASILGSIHQTLDKQHQAAMGEYRKASGERNNLLKTMMPYWRRLTETIEKVAKTITGLEERADVIDQQMATYEEIRLRTDTAEQRLSSSAMVQFVISGLVMLVAIGGAVVNFNLIALPMSEMVGGGSYIGAFRTSDVAGLVIILVEASMGLFLMESLRITRLFPIIGQMDDRMRRKMIWISLTILLVMAGVESSLAFMRDQIAAGNEALRQSLAGAGDVVAHSRSVIPTIGQMVLGFILPFALTFVAIPLESFVHSSRTVLGLGLMWLLRVIAFVLRLISHVFISIGKGLVGLYDLLVFPLLWLEGRFARSEKAAPAGAGEEEMSQ